ncbi:MAG: hypothetical protein QM582_06890 [Micropruina sp.]|uniref:hypothetical protein n=1 Tax=Micropruina sp. TaxID=2737536 RepID=UPI0039E50933
MPVVSWVAAVVCCLGYGIGSVLQSVGAKRAAAVTGVSGLAAIVAQLPYLLGLAADAVAFVANIVAARDLPLFLVQSVMAASIGVTAAIAALRGARLGGRDWAALGTLGAGLVLLAVSASADAPIAADPTVEWVILGGCVLPGFAGLLGLRRSGRRSWVVLATASGLGFSVVGVASRGLGALPVSWDLLTHPMLWSLLAGGVLAMAFFAVALQRGPVTAVTGVTFTIEVVLPSVVGLLLFGDRVGPGLAPLAAAGFVLAIAGTTALARFAQ